MWGEDIVYTHPKIVKIDGSYTIKVPLLKKDELLEFCCLDDDRILISKV